MGLKNRQLQGVEADSREGDCPDEIEGEAALGKVRDELREAQRLDGNLKDLIAREMQHRMAHKRPAPLGGLQGRHQDDEGQDVEWNEA